MKKKLMSLVLALTVVFTSGALASAKDFVKKDYSKLLDEAVKSRDNALVKVNKYDRPAVELKENEKLSKVLTQLKSEALKELDDFKKASKNSAENIYSVDKEILKKTHDTEAELDKINEKINKIDEDFAISEKAQGKDLAKYFFKDKLEEKEQLLKNKESLEKKLKEFIETKDIESRVAKSYNEDASASVKKLNDVLAKVQEKIRELRAAGTKVKEPAKPGTASSVETQKETVKETAKENPLSKLDGDKLNLHPLNGKVVKEIAELAKAKEVKEVKPADEAKKPANPGTGDFGVAAAMTTLVAAGAALVASRKRK